MHLKSTNGKVTLGLQHLTAMVIDEIALLPFSLANLDFGWPPTPLPNRHIYLSPSLPPALVEKIAAGGRRVWQMSPDQALARLDEGGLPADAVVPRFDLAVVGRLDEVDAVVRPRADQARALVRARGAVLVVGEDEDRGNPLARALARGLQIHTSRCGSLEDAIAMLAHFPDLARVLERDMITHQFRPDRLSEAFAAAAGRDGIKVLIRHSLADSRFPDGSG